MLKFVLAANAASCLLFGGIFLFESPDIAALLGDPPVWLVRTIGIGLLANAIYLAVTAARAAPTRRDILTFAIGDAAWVVTTTVLLATGLWITTPAGVAWALGVGAFVGLCGLAQWRLAPASGRQGVQSVQ